VEIDMHLDNETHKHLRRSPPGFLLVGLAYLSFVSLGLPDGLLGVAWPSIRTFFQLPLDALGTLLVTFTIGYLVSSFGSGRILSRLSVGTLLTLSGLATAASLLGYMMAPRWGIIVALGGLAGLGAGAVDAGMNIYAATHFSARTVNWLHACYGVGATIGPAIMSGVLMANYPWQWGYGIVGLWQALLAVCFGLTRRWWLTDNPAQGASAPAPVCAASYGRTYRLPVVWWSMSVFFIYTGLEAAAGTWAFSLFYEARGIPLHTAGTWVSVYWGALTVGRFLSGVAVSIVPIRLFLRFCIVGIALGAMLIWLHLNSLLSCLGLTLMGLASAPIFPSLIATTSDRLGGAHTAHGVGLQIAAAVLGQSLVPSFIGVLARHLGLEIIGPSLLATSLLLLLLYEVLMATRLKPVPEDG
jgi:fucose permease